MKGAGLAAPPMLLRDCCGRDCALGSERQARIALVFLVERVAKKRKRKPDRERKKVDPLSTSEAHKEALDS